MSIALDEELLYFVDATKRIVDVASVSSSGLHHAKCKSILFTANVDEEIQGIATCTQNCNTSGARVVAVGTTSRVVVFKVSVTDDVDFDYTSTELLRFPLIGLESIVIVSDTLIVCSTADVIVIYDYHMAEALVCLSHEPGHTGLLRALRHNHQLFVCWSGSDSHATVWCWDQVGQHSSILFDSAGPLTTFSIVNCVLTVLPEHLDRTLVCWLGDSAGIIHVIAGPAVAAEARFALLAPVSLSHLKTERSCTSTTPANYFAMWPTEGSTNIIAWDGSNAAVLRYNPSNDSIESCYDNSFLSDALLWAEDIGEGISEEPLPNHWKFSEAVHSGHFGVLLSAISMRVVFVMLPSPVPAAHPAVSVALAHTKSDVPETPESSACALAPEAEGIDHDVVITLLPATAPAIDSILCAPYPVFERALEGPGSREMAMSVKSPVAFTNSVTFHSKIKSSGYGSKPPRRPLWAKKASGKVKPLPSATDGQTMAECFQQIYLFPQTTGTSTGLRYSSKSFIACGGIVSVSASPEGDCAVVCGSDGRMYSMRVAQTASACQIPPKSVLLHITDVKAPAKCVSWSHSTVDGFQPKLRPEARGSVIETTSLSRLFISCDKVSPAKVFVSSSGLADAVLTLHDKSSTDARHSVAAEAGSFYYQDKYIVVASGTSCSMFAYEVAQPHGPGGIDDDVVRLRHKHLHRGSTYTFSRWQAAPEGFSVQSVLSLNSMRSPIIVCVASDKAARFYDAGIGGGIAEVLTLSELHEKPIHSSTLPSQSGVMEASCLDALLTASTDGTVKLWDLRSGKCARVLSGGHVNRVHACAAAFSPDMTQVAVGSEDRTAVIYDLRMGNVVVKLRGATDTVTTVSFIANGTTLMSGSLDGEVRFHKMSPTEEGES